MMKKRQSSIRNTVIAPDMVRVRKLMSTCRRLKTVLIDLSGTIHVEDKEIPGAIEALKRLRKSELKTKFVTNTTKESKRVLVERLNKIGFNVSEYDVFTSLTAARDLVCQRHLRPMLVVDDRALEDFQDIPVDNPNAVVIGLAPDKFDYSTLNKAFKLVLDGCPIIAIHKGRYYKTKEGLSLGPGPFVTALEYATDSAAEVVGKPEKQFFLSAISDMNCKAEECIMIGDDVRDDVGGSQSAGMKGILVKTGKYREGDESKIDPRPHHIAEDFPSAVDYILTNLQPPS